jgi:hypothetical protein
MSLQSSSDAGSWGKPRVRSYDIVTAASSFIGHRADALEGKPPRARALVRYGLGEPGSDGRRLSGQAVEAAGTAADCLERCTNVSSSIAKNGIRGMR